MLMVESRWWPYKCLLCKSFNFSIFLNVFVIKYWKEKSVANSDALSCQASSTNAQWETKGNGEETSIQGPGPHWPGLRLVLCEWLDKAHVP